MHNEVLFMDAKWDVRILLERKSSLELAQFSVELAMLLGFHSVSMEFPLCVFGPLQASDPKAFYLRPVQREKPGFSIQREDNTLQISIGSVEDFAPCLAELSRDFKTYLGRDVCDREIEAPNGYRAASDYSKPFQHFDRRAKKGLENLFCDGLLLKDTDQDLLPDKADFSIVLPEGVDESTISAACDLAARFGMETVAYTFPMVSTKPASTGNQVLFTGGEEFSVSLVRREDGIDIQVGGQGKALAEGAAAFCETFPLQGEFYSWQSYLLEMIESLAMKNLDGQLAYLQAFRKELGDKPVCYFSPEVEQCRTSLEAAFPGVQFRNYKGLKEVWSKQYDLPWEVDVYEAIIAHEVMPQLQPGDKVEIYGALSEDEVVRTKTVMRLNRALSNKGVQVERHQLICAYKQGFSWLSEVVLPQLYHYGSISKIIIAFKAFLPEGVTQWFDEPGASPNYNNIYDNDPTRWYDLAIRYLQELYPIDDVLAQKLGISRDQIEFIEYKGERDITYLVTVLGEKDKELLKTEYKASYFARPYLDAYPQLGLVHPASGYVTVYRNGQLLVSRQIDTDTTTVWNIYQKDILPACRDYIATKSEGHPKASDQPFFGQMHFDLRLSEPDYRLPFREDMISSLDALHEDIYFAGTDFFKIYGLQTSGEALDAPGLILPEIRKSTGHPYFAFTLYDMTSTVPSIAGADHEIRPLFTSDTVALWMSRITRKESRWQVELEAQDLRAAEDLRVQADSKQLLQLLSSYALLLNQGLLSLGQGFSGVSHISFRIEGEPAVGAAIREMPHTPKDLDIRSVDMMEGKVIGYQQYVKIIEQLKRVPGIEVYKIASSYLGKDIYAIELMPNRPGYSSRTKRISSAPSEIINGRHHANEVSSTNSILLLLRELLTNEAYRSLPESLNLALIPMENVDGADIHYRLQEQNPYWKLHVARFNAIGKEFYNEYFNYDTINTEALALTRMWWRLLPDAVIDDHGIPTHEWDQQYSGYTSPAFRGFWLPRAQLYGYYVVPADPQYSWNIKLNQEMALAISDFIATDPEFDFYNQERLDRFNKYAHNWLPLLFPAEFERNMINSWIYRPFTEKERYSSVRIPWVTASAYVSEVTDETAQDVFLKMIANTHKLQDLGIIKLLMQSGCVYQKQATLAPGSLSLSLIRKRPVIGSWPNADAAKV